MSTLGDRFKQGFASGGGFPPGVLRDSQLFRPFRSPLLSFMGPSSFSWVPPGGPLPSSKVLSCLSRSPSIFTGPVLSFTGPLPFSRVPFRFHRSPSIFTGPLLSFTDPLLFPPVPFHFHKSPPLHHGSPSVFTGPVG